MLYYIITSYRSVTQHNIAQPHILTQQHILTSTILYMQLPHFIDTNYYSTSYTIL